MTTLESIRYTLGSLGLTAASSLPDMPTPWNEDAIQSPARLVEGSRVQAISLDPAAPGLDCLAFLDGIQRSEIVGYSGASPIVVAEIAAAVRERRHRRLRTVVEERRRIVLARPAALSSAGPALVGFSAVPLPDEDPPHPVRDLMQAARALDRSRAALEVAVGERFRKRSEDWLVVDGALSDSPRWAADPRMVAVSRSLAQLPFDGSNLEAYLRLPSGHRSSVYEPGTRIRAPVRAWGLRLWPWEGRDLLYGLVRVEVAPSNGSPELADQISRWLLAERTPLSAPDRRWDRLLYGIYSVEQYLKAGNRGW